VVCFTLYFLLYTVHYRSFYFIKQGSVYNFETIRYMMGIVIFYCLVCGMSLYRLLLYVYDYSLNKNIKAAYYKIVLFTVCLIAIIGSQVYTYRLRSRLCEVEYVGRLEPVRYVLEHIDTSNSYIITSKSLLFQIYGPDNLKILEFGSIGTGIPRNVLDAVLDKNDVYYLVSEDDLTDANRRRFKTQNKYLESKRRSLIHKGMNYWVYKMQRS
jgi:hypothetical protein